MIRQSQISITKSNACKLDVLDYIFEESKRVINLYIDEIWRQKDFLSKFIGFKVDTWLSATMQQCLGKQALEIVKSQRKRKKQYKPIFKKDSINLDSRIIIDIEFNNNSFDLWFKLRSIGNKISLKLPGKQHKHFHKYNSWKFKKSYQLRKLGNKYFIDLFFEKKSPDLKHNGKEIGIDIGYKKLIVTSENKKYDTDLENVYEKIFRKKQGSKSFKRVLEERDNKINQSINKLPFDKLRTIIVENLKNVKHKTKGRIFKKFNNKLQRWSYTKVLNMLSLRCEEFGILFKKINPVYTSQKCSSCGFKHKNNRLGELFLCLECGSRLDADYNASLNILALGSL